MVIENISKEKRRVTISLSSDELVKIGNVMHLAENDEKFSKDELFFMLYSDIVLARDICQYGHLDSFSYGRVAELRDKAIEITKRNE